MALAEETIPYDSSISSEVQTRDFTEYQKSVLEDEEASQNTNGFSNESAITHSSSLSGNGYVYKGKNASYHAEEAQSLINFKANGYGFSDLMNASESFLSFQQSKMASHSNYLKVNAQKEHSMWDNNDLHQGYYTQWNQISPRSNTDPRLMQDFNCFQTASNYSSIGSTAKEKQNGESSDGWLYSQSSASADELQNSVVQEAAFNKRSSVGKSMQLPAKKQCTNTSKLSKARSITSKDPQSIAAKNRRERISERLKILQELVPNGSKVDLVTMLEKAISYVKFLQLQVKVLATDEFWPVQGGRAPDISQVKEAIDAILSSQKDRNSIEK